ncbi:MAG: NAD(P)H-dependent oxidoreductase subunit E [Deltaproteobacteria bacterium]|jgi:NADH-quinone oxidoreductase subunit E|nr:NAD(P)H-dependent oxidoreductase subunit E [Deltaproteobacteria bacterium]
MLVNTPDFDKLALGEILDPIESQPANLLPMLQAIEGRYRYLPKEAMVEVALRLKIPKSRVFAVANFYKALSLTPKGERIFTVCQGTACHLRGAPSLIASLEKALGISLGQCSKDGRNGLESVNCLGACAMAPVVTVDGEVHGAMTAKKVSELI